MNALSSFLCLAIGGEKRRLNHNSLGEVLPRADFRLKNDTLDPQALVKLLAVMCFPADPRGREMMMRSVPAATTIPRYQTEITVAASGVGSELLAEVSRHQSRANLAGSVCLAMAQLSAFGRPGDAAAVLPLAVELAEKWGHAVRLSTPLRPVSDMARQSETDVLSAYETYRGASHLWAAAVYGRIQFHEELMPAALHGIPRFLAYAEEIARLSTTLAWPEPCPSLKLSAEALWVFVLPTALIRKAAADVKQAAKESHTDLNAPPRQKDASV